MQENLDIWIYCNQIAIARKALAMYTEKPSNGDLKTLIEQYNLYKISPTKLAGLWDPPVIRMKRHTCREINLQIKKLMEEIPIKKNTLASCNALKRKTGLTSQLARLLGGDEWSGPLR